MGFSSGPSHSGPSGSRNPSCGYLSSPGMHNWNRQTQKLAESPHWSWEKLADPSSFKKGALLQGDDPFPQVEVPFPQVEVQGSPSIIPFKGLMNEGRV